MSSILGHDDTKLSSIHTKFSHTFVTSKRYLMRLVLCTLVCSLMIFYCVTQAQQDTSSTNYYKKELNIAEINFLGSYYEQDGDNSPVLGGTGTEYLRDIVGKSSIKINLNNYQLGLSAGIDHYTSASTDNINPSSISSASARDNRVYGNVDLSKTRVAKYIYTWTIGSGFSTEYDVKSISGNFSYSITTANENQQVSIGALYYHDTWELIYPIELRNRPGFGIGNHDVRQVYNIAVTYAQVWTRKLQTAVTAEMIHQKGLLSTPFHRVYFADQFLPDIERLPAQRTKIPLGIRMNYFANDYFLLRTYYRYYIDDFDIQAHTVDVEIPIKINDYFTLSPFYRYYTQTKSRYFAPIDFHSSTESFYTSDYDLSGFDSHKIGFGIRYSPLNGLYHTSIPYLNKNSIQFKKIESRAAFYQRSNGLKSWIISLGLTFVIF